jgi:dTDP-4-dehydrorhamnose 3,5-epimerase
VEKLSIDGAFVFTPKQLPDKRGVFLEWFREMDFRDVMGHPMRLAQANCSVSGRGVIRGVHFAEVPPGQAKYVSCVRGAVLDVVVDIRVGSPTYRQHEFVRLDDTDRRAIYVGEGLGHGFIALTDDATVIYLCSAPHTPEREHSINPMDPELAIGWPSDIKPVLSDRDAGSPALAAMERLGRLPLYTDCVAYTDDLRTRATT